MASTRQKHSIFNVAFNEIINLIPVREKRVLAGPLITFLKWVKLASDLHIFAPVIP